MHSGPMVLISLSLSYPYMPPNEESMIALQTKTFIRRVKGDSTLSLQFFCNPPEFALSFPLPRRCLAGPCVCVCVCVCVSVYVCLLYYKHAIRPYHANQFKLLAACVRMCASARVCACVY